MTVPPLLRMQLEPNLDARLLMLKARLVLILAVSVCAPTARGLRLTDRLGLSGSNNDSASPSLDSKVLEARSCGLAPKLRSCGLASKHLHHQPRRQMRPCALRSHNGASSRGPYRADLPRMLGKGDEPYSASAAGFEPKLCRLGASNELRASPATSLSSSVARSSSVWPSRSIVNGPNAGGFRLFGVALASDALVAAAVRS